MSNRKSVFQNENPNPATRFLEWKSDHQKFAYWDKEKEANVFVELPFKFLALNILHTVKGYSKGKESGIYSNEVKHLKNDIMHVKYFKGNEKIASGYWNEIKDEVKALGGKYTQSIYAMTQKGTLINIGLNGAAISDWFEFIKKTKSRLYDEWVAVEGFKKGKSGKVEYTYPLFEYQGSLNSDEAEHADECFNVLDDYLQKYLDADEHDNEAPEEVNSDDMDIIVNGEKEVNIDNVVQEVIKENIDDLPF